MQPFIFRWFILKGNSFFKLLKTKDPLHDSLPQLITCFSSYSRAHCSSPLYRFNPMALSSRIIDRYMFCFFTMCRKRGETQTTWLCSFNELMNNCWRAAVAITSRSSVCTALLQELCCGPQFIPQSTTTQTGPSGHPHFVLSVCT